MQFLLKLVILCALHFVACGAQGCPSGYTLVLNHCYYFSGSNSASGSVSRTTCQGLADGWLATIDTSDKWTELKSEFSFDTSVSSNGVYFGLRKTGTTSYCGSRTTCTGNVYWDSRAGTTSSSTTGYFLNMIR
jgi:hypothetical protein